MMRRPVQRTIAGRTSSTTSIRILIELTPELLALSARADKARLWFFRWRDKDFSFTDCTSFVVMKELRLRRALTTDRHFRDAGFEAVP